MNSMDQLFDWTCNTISVTSPNALYQNANTSLLDEIHYLCLIFCLRVYTPFVQNDLNSSGQLVRGKILSLFLINFGEKLYFEIIINNEHVIDK